MDIDDTITLDDDRKYTLLERTEMDGDSYFLAIGILEDGNADFSDMVIFKEVEEIDGVYVETELDLDKITVLSKVFEEKLKDREE